MAVVLWALRMAWEVVRLVQDSPFEVVVQKRDDNQSFHLKEQLPDLNSHF